MIVPPEFRSVKIKYSVYLGLFSLPRGSIKVPSFPFRLSNSVVIPLLEATYTEPGSNEEPRYLGHVRSTDVCFPLQYNID